jgi:uncharacterized protein
VNPLENETRFAEGIRLFNQQNFFEAHEVWEEEWKTAEGDSRIFYQGIIQAAVALAHVQRGNHAGGISVYLKSRPKLERFPDEWMGIELGQFRSGLMRYFAALQASVTRNYTSGHGQIGGAEQPPTLRAARVP